jgi:polyphosphate kinase
MSTVARANAPAEPVPLNDPNLYLDRELSLLAFQYRVLDEAGDPENPLLERVKFLSIVFSNLDEFFMVRVAVLMEKARAAAAPGGAEASLSEKLENIRIDVRRLVESAYVTWRDLVPELEAAGIELRDYAQLTNRERGNLEAYFHQTVFPVLTPLAFDQGRPFPHISNLSTNLAVALRDAKGVDRFARVKIPDTLPSLVPVPDRPQGRAAFVWLEQVILANLSALFPGVEIVEAHPFRVTRDAEIEIQELESDDLLESIEEAVWQRRFSAVVRLQVSSDIPEHLLEILVANLELDPKNVYRVDGPLDLSRLSKLLSLDRPDLKDGLFVPRVAPELHPKSEDDVFAVLKREDILLHHPYDSFQPVIEFLRKAAADPDVLAIKITLYRVGLNSPIVEALLTAIENGKQVAVLVELRARFDEESNIGWARQLEAAGVHVVYGLVGLKVHCKVALVVRREGDMIRRYVHLGTGNYNPQTARLYTDLSLFTADDQIGADASDLFNLVTGYSAKNDFRKLLVAPIGIRRRLEEMIRREIDHAHAGKEAHLIFKVNAIEDLGMIRLLYEASQAGVRVDLLVRGICSLRPGVEGVSDNIRVTSILGRFLEHSRIYYFLNATREEIYLGSADLMGRNLNHRVEVLFPVESRRLITRLRDEILATFMADNRGARQMQSDGSFVWDKGGDPAVDSQDHFLELARSN